MAEREHRDPSQEALQKQKKKGRAVWLGLAVAAAVVVLAAVGVCAAAHGASGSSPARRCWAWSLAA